MAENRRLSAAHKMLMDLLQDLQCTDPEFLLMREKLSSSLCYRV